jgi:hypothetical protein
LKPKKLEAPPAEEGCAEGPALQACTSPQSCPLPRRSKPCQPRTEGPQLRSGGLSAFFVEGGVEVDDFRFQLEGPVAPVASLGDRVELQRADGVVEWYRAAPRGIEQGFTVPRRPRGELVLSGRVTSPHPAEQVAGGYRFGGIQYTDLHVEDADGRALASSMEWDEAARTLTLRVPEGALAEARFPVTVDPLISSPVWSIDATDQIDARQYNSASAGDVNRDGYSDLLVGAFMYDGQAINEGRAYLYLGSATGLGTLPAWTQDPTDISGAEFGSALIGAGDVNGDGYSDVLIGAFGWGTGTTLDEGRAYLYLGSATGLGTTPAWTSDPTDEASAEYGLYLGALGDVNGDGFSDVAVGAHRKDGNFVDEGRIYVYYGSATGLPSVPSWTADPADQTSAWLGKVSGAGDVNGDGYADLVMGAQFFDTAFADEGRIWVYLGSSTGLTWAHYVVSPTGQAGANFGRNVVGAGDLDGDGYSEVLVGAANWDGAAVNQGRVYIFFGSASGITGAAFHVDSPVSQADARFGNWVLGLGDTNGDGKSDFAVSSLEYDGPPSNSGRVYFYKGNTSAAPAILVAAITGTQTDEALGINISAAGDTNADGYAELAVGSIFSTASYSREGRVWLYRPTNSGVTNASGFVDPTDQIAAHYGMALAAVGDINGDGFGDLVIGARDWDGTANNEGRIYVVMGSAGHLLGTAGVPLDPTNQADAFFGASVAGAGDVNGDGFADVIVGAPGVNNQNASEGRAFLFLGSASGLTLTPSWSVDPANEDGANFGSAVAGAGDVNADGYADLLVAAVAADGAAVNEGEVFLFLGGPTGPPVIADIGMAPSAQAEARFGASLAGVGDLNGDGYGDIVVGAGLWDGQATDEGRAYVYLGGPGGLAGAPTVLDPTDNAGARYGYSVAGVGDVNGDGLADFAVGADAFDGAQAEEGRAYVYYGNTSAQGFNSATPWVLDPTDQFDARFGTVAGAGDVNGDGYGDVLVGARSFDTSIISEGRAYLYLGGSSGLSTTAVWSQSTSGDNFSNFGTALAGGDFNGDGFSELVVSAPNSDGAATTEGRVFHFHGGDADAGLNRQLGQFQADGITRIGEGGAATGGNLTLKGRVTNEGYMAGRLRMEFELKRLGQPFNGAGTQTSAAVNAGQLASFSFTNLAPGAYRWRARVVYPAGTGKGHWTPFGSNLSGAPDVVVRRATQLRFFTEPTHGVATQSLPAVRVILADVSGAQVNGATATAINLALLTNPGTSTLSGSTSVTTSLGRSTYSNLSLNKVGTGYTLRASATGYSSVTSAAFNITAGAATSLTFTDQPAGAQAGSTLGLIQVTALDAGGNVATGFTGNVVLSLGNNPGAGTLSGTVNVAAVAGVATFNGVSINRTGAGYTLSATSGLLSATSSAFTITPGAASALAFATQPANAVAGASLGSVQVRVVDNQGNTLTGSSASVSLALFANPGSGLLSGTTLVNAVNGVATFSGLSVNKVGNGYVLRATSTGLAASDSAGFNIFPGAAASLVFSGQPPSSLASGVPLSVAVTAFDSHGNLASGSPFAVALTLFTNPSSATLGGTSTVNAVNGVASFSNLSLDKAGSGFVLRATVGAITVNSSGFNVTSGPASTLAFTDQPASSVAGTGMGTVQVTAYDSFGNTATTFNGNVAINVLAHPSNPSLAGTTSVLATAGVATFSSLQIARAGTGYVLRASSTGVSSSNSSSFDVSPGAASGVVFRVQPGNGFSGQALPDFEVSVVDGFGNTVPGSSAAVTVQLENNAAGGTLVGTTTLNAVGGNASFIGLRLDKAGTDYDLRATSPGLSFAVSSPFSVFSGTAAALAFLSQPAGAQAREPLGNVQIEVRDAAGNPIAGALSQPITLSLVTANSGATLTGTLSQPHTGGAVSFNDLAVTRPGTFQLRASNPGLTDALSSSFVVTPPPVAELFFSVQPANGVAGQPLADVQVSALDAFGDPVPGYNAAITLSLDTNLGNGTLGGTLTRTFVDGVVTFSGLTLDKAAGGYSLSATSGAFTKASLTFDISAGAASALKFAVQPANGVAGEPLASVEVRAEDALGNPATSFTGNVTLSLGTNPSAAALAGTVSMAAVAGVASFTGLTVDRAGAGYSLTAVSPAIATAFSDPFDLAPGPAAVLVFTGQPGDAESLATLGSVQVTARSAAGDLDTAFNGAVELALVSPPQGATLAGTLLVNAVGGVATFEDLSVARAGSGYTLRATSGSLTPATSAPFAVRTGPAARLAFATQPLTTAVATALNPVEVQVLDAALNPVTAGSHPVSLALASGAAVLGGTLTAASSAGSAIFSELTLDREGPAFTLRATSGSLAPAVSAAFVVLPASQAPPTIEKDARLKAMVGVAYLYNDLGAVRARGAQPMSFSRCGGPSGFQVEPATGAVRWVPTEAGTVQLCVGATNSFGSPQYTFSVVVAGTAGTQLSASLSANPVAGAAPLEVTFDGSASSADASARPLAFRWRFGDGSPPAYGATATHRYLLAGGYQARLRVFDAFGNAEDAAQALRVSDSRGRVPPRARIVATPPAGPAPLAVQLSCDCEAGSAPLRATRWTVDGVTSSGPTLSTTLAEGVHQVVLEVVDANGLTATDALSLSADAAGWPLPDCRAWAEPSEGVAPLAVTLHAAAGSPAGPLASLRWEFPEGSASAEAPLERTFGVGEHWLTLVRATGASGELPPRILSQPSPEPFLCGQPFRYSEEGPAAAGTGPFTWSLDDAPEGMTADPTTGQLSWTPKGSSTTVVALRATNEVGSDVQRFAVDVTCPPDGAGFATGCGCNAGTSAPLWGALAALMLLLRARLSRSSAPTSATGPRRRT